MHRGWLRAGVLALSLALGGLSAGAAGAADPAPAGAEGHKEEKPGPIDPRPDLTIWTIVVFALLYLTLRYVKLPGASAPAFVMMLDGLRKREENIRGALAEAQQTRDEAHRLRDQLQGEINKAHEKVRDILDDARRDAKQLTDDMAAKARTEIQTERDRLRREIDTARDQALQQLWNQAADLATLVAAKAVRRQINADDNRRLVDEALAELRRVGGERAAEVASMRA